MPETNDKSFAVLLIAHGSRRRQANDDLERLAEIVRRRGPYPIVHHSYLELADPSIAAGVKTCIDLGAVRVLMLPWFLSAGAHVVDDLRRFRDELAAQYPGVEIILCPPLGLHELMIDVVLDRLQEGIAEAKQ